MSRTQRDLAHINDLRTEVDLLIQVGNAGIGSTVVKLNGNTIKDSDGNDKIFPDSFSVDVNLANNFNGRMEIEAETKITPNIAVEDKSMILSYDLTNAKFFTGKSRTIKVPASAGLPSETFFVTINLL